MANISVKFVSQKVNKVRWQPGDLQGLQPSNVFVTGSWDNDENRLCLWHLPDGKDKGKYVSTDRFSSVTNGDTDWDDTEREPQLVCQESHKGDVTDLKFVNSETLLASSSAGSVQAYKLLHESQKLHSTQQWLGLHRLQTRSCPCTCIAVSGTDVATAGEDGRINVIRIEQKHPIRTIDEADSSSINALTYLKSHQVVSVNSTGQMKIWDLRQPGSQPTRVFLLTGEKTALHCVDRHPTQAHLVVAGSQDSILNVWDLRQEKFPVTLFDGHQGPIWEVKFHPTSSDHLFTCSEDGSVFHWNGSGSQSLPKLSAATGDSIYPSLGLGGLPSKPSASSPTSPWLNNDTSNQVDTNHVLPSNIMPVNSLDVEGDKLVCGTDGEAVFVVNGLGLR